MGIGDVTGDVVLPLERGWAERAGVAAGDFLVGVTRQEVFPQKFLLRKFFIAVRTIENSLRFWILVRR